MTSESTRAEAMEILEGWSELWRHPGLFRQLFVTPPAALAESPTITEAALQAMASPVDVQSAFRAFIRGGDFAAASALLDAESLHPEPSRTEQTKSTLKADLEEAVNGEQRRQHVMAEGLRMRALQLGKLDSQLVLQLQQAVTAVAQSRHSSEAILRDIERRLGGPSGWAQAEQPTTSVVHWPYKDAAMRVCSWFLGEEKSPPDAAHFAPALDDADALQLLRLLRRFCGLAGRPEISEAASLLAAIERFLGTVAKPVPVVQKIDGVFRAMLRGLDSPWLPELGSTAFPEGVPFLIARQDDKLPSPSQLPDSLFVYLALSDEEAADLPERGLRISPSTFFSLLKDKASRREQFLAELGAHIPRSMVEKDAHRPVFASGCVGGEREDLQVRRQALGRRLATLGIRDLHPVSEVLDRLAFCSGGLVQLESRLIWEITQRQRVFGRRRQTRLDLEDVQVAYDSPRFQEYARGCLLDALDNSPAERLVLGSLCEALGSDLLIYPVAISDLAEWLQMNDRRMPKESLFNAVVSLISRGLLECVAMSAAGSESPHSIRLPSSGVGHLILRELAVPDRVRIYVDGAYQEWSTQSMPTS
jgi:hypothetical protein